MPEEIKQKVRELAYEKAYQYVQIPDKIERDKKLDELKEEVLKAFEGETEDTLLLVDDALYNLEKRLFER